MLFNFRLTPIELAPPFGRDGDWSLHWFGLTYGCYWLTVGDTELFRYRQQFLDLETEDYDDFGCLPHVDYMVARLWEDVLDILPDVLAPVPPALADKLAAPNSEAWRARIEHRLDSHENGLWKPAYEHATEWWRKRQLVSGHLTGGPKIWFWNDGTHIHIEWDNRAIQSEAVAMWTADVGTWLMSVEDFLSEIRTFDTALIDAMQQRISQIRLNWPRPDVRLDVNELALEHADRVQWLARALRQVDQARLVDWNAIIQAIARVESETDGLTRP